MKKVYLTRDFYTKNQTTGVVVVENEKRQQVFASMSLELPQLDNKKGISCIPKGTYYINRITSPKLGLCYAVEDVKDRIGILIHVGNYYTQIRGCILIGISLADINKDNEVDILNSKIAMEHFSAVVGTRALLIIR